MTTRRGGRIATVAACALLALAVAVRAMGPSADQEVAGLPTPLLDVVTRPPDPR